MLFKYLLAPIALAAATSAWEGPASKGIDFQVIIQVTEKFEAPITKSCTKELVPDVVKDLTSIYTPVLEVSEKFHSEKLEKKFVLEQAKLFFSFLQKFEVILKVISQHPRVSRGCHQKISQFNSKFALMIIDIKRYEIDLKNALAGINLDLSLWTNLGFDFQSQLGIHL